MERITRKEVVRAAKDFGSALFECQERKALKKAEEAFRNSNETRRILSDYQFKQRDLQMAHIRGAAISEEDRIALDKLETEVRANPLINDLMEKRKQFQETMKSLNTEISGLLGIDFSANSSTGGCC